MLQTKKQAAGQSESSSRQASLSVVVIQLMKGVVQRQDDERLWQDLLNLQVQAREYLGVLGLELILDEAEGYAYLRQQKPVEGEPELPRLVARRPLSYPVSLLLVLLRKKLVELDAAEGSGRPIVKRSDIVHMFQLFVKDTENEAKLTDRVDGYINKVIELGFLRKLRGRDEELEIQRILKGFVDAQWLGDFEQRLSEYKQQLTEVIADKDVSHG